ncbi:Importin-11 [Eumeta japonica]|uniref:Importin-11 n=1 Tax=Eumeta variegata TaxID=151549 RepID=A0A4C1SC28_EUMVA|nr:Importin-11 [Eumeta japonica]
MEVIQEIQQPDALEKILDVWITKMPLVTELEKLKLFCLAFLSIFSNNPILLERFPAIMQNISDTLFEVMREDDETNDYANNPNEASETKPVKYCDSLVFIDEYDLDTSMISYATDDFDYKTYHYDRCRQLALKDPVHKIALPQYIEWQLNNLRTQLGDEAYQHLMRSVYPAVLERFSQFVNLQITFPIN